MILMIDNYDSFTYNLVDYCQALGEDVKTRRNDQVSIADIRKLSPEKIIISPGPCSPNESGITLTVIKQFSRTIPILGVCLGHQAIAQAFGAKICRADKVMHGKTSPIYHYGKGVFHGLPTPFRATRYHSLVVENDSLPDCLEVTASTPSETNNRDIIMGLRHRSLPLEGVQFHPESILSEHGHRILQNFLALSV